MFLGFFNNWSLPRRWCASDGESYGTVMFALDGPVPMPVMLLLHLFLHLWLMHVETDAVTNRRGHPALLPQNTSSLVKALALTLTLDVCVIR